MYEVILLEPAQDFYNKAGKSLKKKLDRCFESLSNNPFKSNNIKKLKAKFSTYYRFRLGDYRVIYRVDTDGKLIIVAIIAHRSSVYK